MELLPIGAGVMALTAAIVSAVVDLHREKGISVLTLAFLVAATVWFL
jgi:hypothetical protein